MNNCCCSGLKSMHKISNKSMISWESEVYPCAHTMAADSSSRVLWAKADDRFAENNSNQASSIIQAEGLSVYFFLTSIPHYPVAQGTTKFHSAKFPSFHMLVLGLLLCNRFLWRKRQR